MFLLDNNSGDMGFPKKYLFNLYLSVSHGLVNQNGWLACCRWAPHCKKSYHLVKKDLSKGKECIHPLLCLYCVSTLHNIVIHFPEVNRRSSLTAEVWRTRRPARTMSIWNSVKEETPSFCHSQQLLGIHRAALETQSGLSPIWAHRLTGLGALAATMSESEHAWHRFTQLPLLIQADDVRLTAGLNPRRAREGHWRNEKAERWGDCLCTGTQMST